MAAPMEDVCSSETLKNDENFCTIEATVVTGFEEVAAQEAEERFNTKCKILKGRISIKCPIEKVEQVTDLGCVDNCRVVMTYIPNFKFTDDQNDNLQRLRNLVGLVDWPAGINIWRKFFSFEHDVADRPAEITTDFGEVVIPPPRQKVESSKNSRRSKRKNKWKKKSEKDRNKKETDSSQTEGSTDVKSGAGEITEAGDAGEIKNRTTENSINIVTEGITEEKHVNVKSSEDNLTGENDLGSEENVAKKPRVRENPWNPIMPSFRVTCNRTGDKHNFDSMTAASNFGGAVYRYFGWNVKLTEFDIEVILGLEDHQVTVSIGLTKESLHRRNITHFGPTTLRPTIAYGMLRLCNIEKGEIVCDPMSGSGSIPIQGALRWASTMNIAGEISKKALDRCAGNIQDLNEDRAKENKSPLLIDPIKWNVCNLPLRDHTVDVFITDLPFGVRMGHKANNWSLYPGALFEMARVVKPETGRCCLLTEDKKCMIKTLQHLGKYWKRSKTLGINIGGLAGAIYVLKRSAEPFDKTVNRDIFAAKGKKGRQVEIPDSPVNSGDEM